MSDRQRKATTNRLLKENLKGIDAKNTMNIRTTKPIEWGSVPEFGSGREGALTSKERVDGSLQIGKTKKSRRDGKKVNLSLVPWRNT